MTAELVLAIVFDVVATVIGLVTIWQNAQRFGVRIDGNSDKKTVADDRLLTCSQSFRTQRSCPFSMNLATLLRV